jgi:hypothetical protein
MLSSKIRSVASFTLLALAIGGSSMLTGCSSPVDSSDDTAVSKLGAKRTQKLSFLTDAELTARIDAFKTRNGAGWQEEGLPSLSADRVTGAITLMRRVDAYGEDRPISQSSAGKLARQFAIDNADMLNLTADEIGSLQTTIDAIAPGGDYVWSVALSGSRAQVGYEEFRSVDKKTFYSLSIGKDGTVRSVHALESRDFPKLELEKNAAKELTDQVIVDKLTLVDLNWVTQTQFNQPATTTAYGKILAADVATATPLLRIHAQTEANGVRLTLGYELHVHREGAGGQAADWVFVVDTDSGNVIDQVQGTTIDLP